MTRGFGEMTRGFGEMTRGFTGIYLPTGEDSLTLQRSGGPGGRDTG